MPVSPGRPSSTEYAPFYAGYVDQVEGDDILTVLSDQRAGTLSLLRGLTEEQGAHRYAPGKWSVKEVLGHVTDGERIFTYRALSFARGESQGQPGFDQDAYVDVAKFDRRSLVSIGDEYESVRRATLTLFESFGEEAWQRVGIANGVSFSVRGIAFITAGHEAHHIKVLRERYLSPPVGRGREATGSP